MKEVIRYECEHCADKNYKHKSSAKSHEKKCYANPETKSCRTCKNYIITFETVYDRNHGGDPGSSDYEEECRWCESYEEELTKLKTNCKNYSKGVDNFK